MLVRRIQPEDAPRLQAFVRALSPGARRERFFAPVQELTAAQLRRMTLNPGLTLGAFDRHGAVTGLAEYSAAAPGEAEFALVVSDAWQRRGLGEQLLWTLIEHARARGFLRITGITRESNQAMRALARRAGFVTRRDGDPAFVRLERPLIHDGNKPFLERNSAITSAA